MSKPNTLKVTILPDGTVKTETGAFAGASHATAEAMLRELASELGGETTRKRLPHTHAHEHAHEHEHAGIKHKH
jgi:hypothetical protein